MFFLSNRYSVHGVVMVIALVAVGVNLSFNTVRAESSTFGEKSLLYAAVAQDQVEVIDVYADTERPDSYGAPSYLGDSTIRTDAGNVAVAPPPSDTTTTSTNNIGTAAPRSGVITYIVLEGDTLGGIAQKFGISLNTVLWANGLTAKSVLKPGVSLTILPTSGVQYTVRSGDTLTAIAKKYQVGTSEILAANNISSANSLKIGASLIIPGGSQLSSSVKPSTSSTSRVGAVSSIFATPPAASSTGVVTASGKMVWPSVGHYVVRGLSLRHTGVDIDCDGHANGTSTADNYAAADGTVQFAGAKGGYGNAVEINHGNGIVTRYGHFYKLYVTKGQVVAAGTPLGRCGSTGNSTGTHLHFEVILNGKFQNPLNYLL